MSAKDNPTADSAEIGEALVAALGFEPADGKKLGRKSGSSDSETITMNESLEDLSSSPTNGDSIDSAPIGDVVTDITSGDTAAAEAEAAKSLVTETPATDAKVGPATTGEIPGVTADAGSSSSPPPPGQDDAIALDASALDDILGDAKPDGNGVASDSSVSTVDAGQPGAHSKSASDKPGAHSKGTSKKKKRKAAAAQAATSSAGETLETSKVDADKTVSFDASAVPTSPPTAAPVASPSADVTADTKLDVPADSPMSPAAPTAETKLEPAAPVANPQPAAQPAGAVASSSSNPVSDFFSKNPFRQTRKVQARKVRRVVRHIDPWSVLTFSVLFHLCVFAALLLASVLVWNAAEAAGTIENIETFILELGDYDTFEIKGEVVFRAAVAIAGILTLASSVLIVLLTVIFNLISDLVGGIRLTVIEEETVRVKRRKKVV